MRWLLLMALSTAACAAPEHIPAGSPSVVPPPAAFNATGSWAGVTAVTISGQRGQGSTHFVLEHSAATGAVTGTWRTLAVATVNDRALVVGDDIGGSFTGSLTAAGLFAGTATWDSSSATPGVRCTGSAPVSGSFQRERFTLTSSGFTFNRCIPASDVVWTAVVGIGTVR